MKPNNLLRRERELRGWSQARVANAVGTTALNVGRWERGTSLPYPYFRERLCTLFGKDAEALGLLEVENEPAEPSLASSNGSSGEPRPPDVARYDPAIPLPPSGNRRLVGRDELLLCIKRRICSDVKPTLTALHGLPGVGKTALAIDVAYDPTVRTHFQDGILWAGPGLKPDVMELLSRWGKLLGVSPSAVGKQSSSETWARAIRAEIGRRQMLLVIDDAWEIEEALAFQVGGPCCAYLVTTRYPNLAVQLAGNGAQAVSELTETDGVTLLARYAPEFVTRAPETAQALVHSVGALPLALTLIGKYLSVQVYSGQPRRLHAALEHLRDARARLQLSEARALAERHPSLATGTTLSLQSVIAVSEQLLDECTTAALRALSIFPAKPNSFAEEAALEICQAPVETLDRLCDAGLLESNGPSRYMLHQTISDYARTSLTDQAVSERLVHYYMRFVEVHANDHSRLELETTNILAALEVAYKSLLREELARGACAFAGFMRTRGLYSLAEKHLKRAYAAASALDDTSRMISALLHLGPVKLASGNVVQAEDALLEGLELARKIGHDEQICALLSNLATVEEERGNFQQAEACIREGLELARALGKQDLVCRLLTTLGVITGKRGDHGQARSYFREGLALARKLGQHERIPVLLLDLGRVEYERGNYRRSEVYYQESLNQAQRFGYHVLSSGILIYLGEMTLRQGRFAQSRDYFQRATILLRRVGNYLWLDQALLGLGALTAVEGNHQQAEDYFQECLEIAQRLGDREALCRLFEELGKLETQRGNYEAAEVYLQDALRVGRDVGQNYLVSSILFALGILYVQCERLDEASLHLEEMREIIPHDQPELQAMACYGLARIAYARRQIPTARQQGETGLAIFCSLGHYRATEVKSWLEQI